MFPFVRYKFLLRIGIILYFVSLFLVSFFGGGGKDEVLFPNAVERNFQSFNLSSAVRSVLQLEFPYWGH